MAEQPTGQKPTNPPAFPRSVTYGAEGMDLRDYFAAKALVGLMLTTALQGEATERHANWAYQYADAMLKARTATPAPPRPLGLDHDTECPSDCWCQTGIDE